MSLQSLIDKPKELLELIDSCLKPKQKEKRENGEVFTPMCLVFEMLDNLDNQYSKEHGRSIFTEPSFKWFDPSSGMGNFPVAVYLKLMEGLKIPNVEDRKKHIIENMLYMSELNEKNVFIIHQIFNMNNHYKLNLYEGDTLTMDVKKEFGIDSFDVVMGNPPYNSSGNIATGNTLWQRFTKNGLQEWLLPNGYLVFVHPPGWRKPNTERGKFTKMFDLMAKENQMLYLEIHGIKDGQKVFNCGTRYDWYVIKKTKPIQNTIILDEDGKQNVMSLSEWSWLPNSNILEINKIRFKSEGERCPIMYDRTAYGADKKDRVSSIQTQGFKYPCVHSTPKSGIRYMYSSVNDRGHFGVSKVIFGESGIYKPVIDMEGKYGMTNGAMGIQVDNLEEATFISKVIESDRFNKILKSCLFSSYRVDWNIFKEFKKDFLKYISIE